MENSIAELEQMLFGEMPVARAMGIKVVRYDTASLVLGAPLAPNINPHGSAFAGSLYSLAVLVGWSWLQLKLAEMKIDARAVIHQSSIVYHTPVEEDFEAKCECSSAATLDRFLAMLQSRGRSRITLHSRIEAGGKIAVTFEGSYVVFSSKKA